MQPAPHRRSGTELRDDLDAQIATLRREGTALADAVRRDPDLTLISCPDWTAGRLLAHVDSFARWVAGLVDGTDVVDRELPVVAPEEAMATWDADLARLVATPRAAAPEDTVANWAAAPDTAAFWQRRAAHEFAVHRWDAQTALPEGPSPIEATVARDGVAEFFDVFVATGIAQGMVPPATASLTVEFDDGGEPFTHDLPYPGPVTTIRGSASDLMLAMWHRVDPMSLHVDGPREMLEAWRHI
jgi:uncharacterized protein (TIGR03083 family)